MTLSGIRVRFGPMGRDRADHVSDMIEALAPAPDAVALDLADEASDLWNVDGYFSNAPAAAALERIGESFAIEDLPDIDWVSTGLSTLDPVRAGRMTLYGDHQRERFGANRFAVEVNAGAAFGTGHHGSTWGALLALDLCLRQRRPCRMLDIGTGSGVLAIAAARLGAGPIVASDIDPAAVQVAEANARANRVRGIQFIAATGTAHPKLRPPRNFDLIAANILARPLMALAGPIAEVLSPGGRVILSGLMAGQDRTVQALYRARGLIVERRILREGWATVILRA